MNGRLLKKALRSAEAYKLLDKITDEAKLTWLAGGCLILAKSLKMLYPAGELLVVWNNRQQHAEHAVLLLDGQILDGDGASNRKGWLARYTEKEFGKMPWGYLSFQPFEPDYATGWFDVFDTRLAEFLAPRLGVRLDWGRADDVLVRLDPLNAGTSLAATT